MAGRLILPRQCHRARRAMVTDVTDFETRVSMIVLAAGKGSRMGTPKVLLRMNDGTSLLSHHLRALAAVDPAEILVVLGAGAHQAQSLIPDGVKTILNLDHAMGMGRSLQTGLRAVDPHSNVAVVTLVDLTDTPAEIYPRLIENATDGVLARCTWGSVPGHPVMFGRKWISRAIEACGGDSGAKRLFRGFRFCHTDRRRRPSDARRERNFRCGYGGSGCGTRD